MSMADPSPQQQQQQPRPAYCEEFSEETQAAISDTRQSASVTARHSATAAKPKSGRDEQSDSGYSSHTHSALNSSLDSRIDTTLTIPPATAPQSSPLATAKPSARVEKITTQPKSRPHSPEKNSLRQTGSTSRKDGSSRRKECACDKCLPDPRRSAVPIRPSWVAEDDRPRAHRSQRSSGAIEPFDIPREHIRPRPTQSRTRPMSFHAGTMPDPMFLSQPHYLLERQPPVRPTAYPFPAPQAYPPPQAYVEHVYPFQPAPPLRPAQNYIPQASMAPMTYEIIPQPRPRPRRLTSDETRARPQSMYYGNPPPIYEYAEPVFKTDEPKEPIQRQLSRRGRRESLRSSQPTPKDDRELMPPPTVPKPPRLDTKTRPEHRPTPRQAYSAAEDYPSQSSQLRGGGQQVPGSSPLPPRESRKSNAEEASRSRRPSSARAPKNSEEKAVTFDDTERDNRRTSIGSSPAKSRRQSSVYGHESLEDAEGSIEAYQQAVRSPSKQLPVREDVVARLMREKRGNSLQKSNSEDGGSRLSAQSRGSRGSRSSRDGSERHRQSSISDSKALERRPTTDVGSARSAENKEAPFALRFKPQDTNVTMAGSIDGRAISLRKSKEVEGDVELSIESHAAYESQRGRKAITSSSSSRPPLRQQSHKRYSYIEGQGVQEITSSGHDRRDSVNMTRVPSQRSDEQGPKIVGERIVTTVRSRRSSRYGRERYDGRDRYDYDD